MKTIGIVAEYNPFHNGHKYQIEQAKKQLGADNVVVVMSGNFVQRGGFAWTDKYLRARMAVDCGADLVFELPVVFSCASAETFALGSVALLDSLGFVDEICFGSEEGSLAFISKIAHILNNDDYISEIDKYLKSGLSFPAAREKFLTKMFPDEKENITSLLKQPNNILAIEYIKALNKLNSRIKPVTIKRMDAGYHSTKLGRTDNSNPGFSNALSNISASPLSSASAIRNAFTINHTEEEKTLENTDYSEIYIDKSFALSNTDKKEKLKEIFEHIPKEVYDILSENPDRFPADNSFLNNMMYYKLLSFKLENRPFDIFSDISSDLSERIYNKLPEFKDFDGFADILKTKQYTHTRITRALTHILLDIKTADIQEFNNSLCNKDKTLYARLLGMNKNKSYLLRNITDIPVITKVADARRVFEKFWSSHDKCDITDNTLKSDLNNNVHNGDKNFNKENKNFKSNNSITANISRITKMFDYDIFAADLYRHCMNNAVPDEYRAGIYIAAPNNQDTQN